MLLLEVISGLFPVPQSPWCLYGDGAASGVSGTPNSGDVMKKILNNLVLDWVAQKKGGVSDAPITCDVLVDVYKCN